MWMFQGDPCAPGLRKEIYQTVRSLPLYHLNILLFLGVNKQARPSHGCAWVNILLIHTLHIIIHVLINPLNAEDAKTAPTCDKPSGSSYWPMAKEQILMNLKKSIGDTLKSQKKVKTILHKNNPLLIYLI